jgi:peptide/nickel transport system substrate-binding protein
MKFFLKTAFVALLCCSLFSAAAVDAKAEEKEIVYGAGVDPRTMDPQMVDSVPGCVAVMHVHETLVQWDDGMNTVGCLAERWEISEDNKSWTFFLRKGIKFHDDADFDAHAVKKSFERILDPATASPRRSIFTMIEKIEVVDDHTVKFTTKDVFAPFLSQMATYNAAILSPRAIDTYGKDYSTHPAGTGAFKLKEWIPSETLVFEKNENYWAEKKPAVDRIIFKIIPESTTRVMALQTGEVDIIANLPPIMMDRVRKIKNVEVILAPGFRTIYVGMNTSRPPLDNLLVRRAVCMAIDREALIHSILQGAARLGVGIESTIIPGSASDLVTYPYDPEGAKRLLAEAGYPDGIDVNFHSPFGRYIMDKQVAEAIQAQLTSAGIRAKLQVVDWSLYNTLTREGKETHLFLSGKGSPSGDLDFTMSIVPTTGGSMNYSFISDPEVDALVEEQRRVPDPDKRREVLHRLQTRLQEVLPWAALYYEDQILGKRANLTGERIWPNEFVDLRFADKN